MNTLLLMLVAGLVAGALGSILGLGGGIIVTPVLTLMMGLDIKYAIGASIIAVIATSSGATIAFLKDDVLNLRVAMFLEIATTIGAVGGAMLSGVFNTSVLFILFGAFLLLSVYNMIKKIFVGEEVLKSAEPDRLSTKFKLNSSYYDKQLKKQVDYQVENVPGGMAIMLGAGVASGLLGIGSGIFKVMAMDTAMKMPLKPSSSTSNLMMGVTAAASATVYFFNGSIRPDIAVPLALGILVGSSIGSRVMQYLPAKIIRLIFVPVLIYVSAQMILKGFGVSI
ncbi:sulfite exporter TauE/SafE family protein [Dellaglioa sp. BT-FLS60]